MARNTLRQKVRQLDEKHPGLAADLNESIRKGKRAHWISSYLHHRHNVRLQEDFIVRYANYRNLFAEDNEDQATVEDCAEGPAVGAAEGRSNSVQEAQSAGQGREREKVKGDQPEATGVSKGVIIRALGRKVAQMLRKAEADPNSDAHEYIRILLLNGLATEEFGYQERAFMKLIEAEHKEAALKKALEHEKFERRQAGKRWGAKTSKIRQTLQNVDDATAQGVALDHEEIFRQISAVIGVGQPLPPPRARPEACGSDAAAAQLPARGET